MTADHMGELSSSAQGGNWTSPDTSGQGTELPDVLVRRPARAGTHVILDGSSTATGSPRGNTFGKTINERRSGKHRGFGGNIQFVSGIEVRYGMPDRRSSK
jgi:hypothetical protein